MATPYSGPYRSQDPNPTDEEKYREAGEILLRLSKCDKTAGQIASDMGMSRRTFYNRLKLAREGRPRKVSRGRPWRTDVGYTTVHQRLRKTLGSAMDRPCRECNAQAAQWAYTNEDPDELVDDQGLRYSLDLQRYVPLCHSCHIRFDAAHRRTV